MISEKDNKNKLSINELEKKLIESLKEIGIDISKDLLLKDLSSNFRNQLIFKDDIVLSKEYELLVRDGRTVGKVGRVLEKEGISNVRINRTDHSKMEQFRKQVKMNAIKAAQENAEILTTAIGQTIGTALFIQELYSNIFLGRTANTFMEKKAMSGMSDMIENEQAIDFEKIKLEFTVLVRFEIK